MKKAATIMNITSNAFATGGELLNQVRRIGTKFVTALQPFVFEAVLFVTSAPRRISYAYADYAAKKRIDVKAAAQYQAAMAQSVQNAQTIEGGGQPAAATSPAIVFTPPAKGLIALSRENPQLAILVACLIMGLVQIGMVTLTIFMVRDAGYSSGWGDATKYFVDCQKQ